MRRRFVGVLTAAALSAALLGTVQPASATHGCTNPNCFPVTVAILEGIGHVCSADAGGFCTYQTDQLWPSGGPPGGQGLYWPGFGPPARGPFKFGAGPGTTPPTSLCVSSVDGEGCQFNSQGLLSPGSSGFGAYCGSSEGAGTSVFRSNGANGLIVNATFGWDQSAATILPLQGTVTSTNKGNPGGTVVGFTSSRGTGDGANCGISQVTNKFNVEGMIVTF